MNLRAVLQALAAGDLSLEQAEQRLAAWPIEDLGFAKLDHHRRLRCGQAEVVFGAGKSVDHLLAIFDRLRAAGENILATRVRPAAARQIVARYPDAVYDPLSRTLTWRATPRPEFPEHAPHVALLAAGTADLRVAEEARITLELADCPVRSSYDVGVAGLARLLMALPEIRQAAVVVVVAGMDGALPSVTTGLVTAPVIAVPTSVGYGASFGGVAALLTMLNACAPGVAVVNIDNGFGAAAMAQRMLATLGHRAPNVPAAGEGRAHA